MYLVRAFLVAYKLFLIWYTCSCITWVFNMCFRYISSFKYCHSYIYIIKQIFKHIDYDDYLSLYLGKLDLVSKPLPILLLFSFQFLGILLLYYIIVAKTWYSISMQNITFRKFNVVSVLLWLSLTLALFSYLSPEAYVSCNQGAFCWKRPKCSSLSRSSEPWAYPLGC